MADEQSNIAHEQLPIYEKATQAQYGSGDDTQSGTAEQGRSTAKFDSPQPPASNPGADDATGGIPEGAGGLSSTAHIESPVSNNDQTLFSSVKSMLGFGGAPEEVKAEDKGPAEDATTAPRESLLAGSAIAAPIAAVTGSSTSHDSVTAAAPTSTSSDLPSTGTGKGTYLDYQQASSKSDSAFPSSQTLPIRSTPGGSLDNTSTTTAQADTTSKSTASNDKNIIASSTTNDESSSSKMTEHSDAHEDRDPPNDEKPPKPADGKPTTGKGIENRDAIPTAGGEKLGEKNWGESNFVPDDPQAKSAGVASKDGQPNDQVKDNTAKNTGGATSGPHDGKQGGESGEGKEKFVDKIKDKLHIGSKK